MERGMAFTPKWNTRFFFAFSKTRNSAIAAIGLKEMKISLEGREKGLPCWLSQFSRTKLRQPTGQSSLGKCNKKVWYYEKWVGRHASFPPRQSVKRFTKHLIGHRGLIWILLVDKNFFLPHGYPVKRLKVMES